MSAPTGEENETKKRTNVEQIEEKMVEMNQLAFPHKAVKSKSTILSPPNCDFTIYSEIVTSLAHVPHVLLLSSKICNILIYESLYCSRTRE
jgi:hypothetical protein